MRALFVSSEVTGFAKTGGLADVSASLPPALKERGVDIAVIMPLYRSVREGPHRLEPTPHVVRVSLGNRLAEGAIWKSTLPGTEIPVYLVENAKYFERDNPATGASLYTFTDAAGVKSDYGDNCERFIFFCRAVLEAIPLLNFWPEIIHHNDWQTAPIAVFLRENYARLGKETWRRKYESIRTLLTLHNLGYQGNFWYHDWFMLNLPGHVWHPDLLEFHGNISFLKGGLVYADALNAVSPTYAREIQTTLYGHGMHGVLMRRGSALTGIVNGIDARTWNPATDPYLAANYDETSLGVGKARCKQALQQRFGLEVDPAIPLLGVVSRLATQKGFDLLQQIAPYLLQQRLQLVLLGQGEAVYESFFHDLHVHHPSRVGLAVDLSEPIAHQIEAGADMFLMPSAYEPCGLNQLYSLRYGTVPVVRATGGLADTVVDATLENMIHGKATGFTFVSYAGDAFFGALQRALEMYRLQPAFWRQLQVTGMKQDWSWNRSAAEYVKLYGELLAGV